MRRSFRVVVGCWAACATACGLLYDPSELSSEYGRAEAGTTSPDATTSSSGSSGSAPIEGGGNDAPAPSDAGTFCERLTLDATICDDFDKGVTSAAWSEVYDAGTYGTMTFASSPSSAEPPDLTSAPNALVLSAASASEREGPHLRFVDKRATGRRVTFSVIVESADDAGVYRLADFFIRGHRYFLEAHGRDVDLVIDYLDGNVGTYRLVDVDLKTMTRMVFEVDTTQRLVLVKVDDVIKQSQNPPAPSGTGDALLRLGIPNVRSVQTVRVRYDNVIVE